VSAKVAGPSTADVRNGFTVVRESVSSTQPVSCKSSPVEGVFTVTADSVTS